MIKTVFKYCDEIDKTRNSYGILSSLVEEVGELSTEVGIQMGHTNKECGPDGILGESIDIILCSLDMIRRNYPDITKKDIKRIAIIKCEKWKRKVDSDYDEDYYDNEKNDDRGFEGP